MEELVQQIEDCKVELRLVRHKQEETTKAINLFCKGKMSNQVCDREGRTPNAMQVRNYIAQKYKIEPNHGWRFYVTSIGANVVFNCYSPVKVLTRNDLCDLISASLPEDFDVGTVYGKSVWNFGYLPLKTQVDLAHTHSFTCN